MLPLGMEVSEVSGEIQSVRIKTNIIDSRERNESEECELQRGELTGFCLGDAFYLEFCKLA